MLKVVMLASALVIGATGLATAATNQTHAAGANPHYPFQTSSNDSSSSATPMYSFATSGESCSYLKLNHNPANDDGNQHFHCGRG